MNANDKDTIYIDVDDEITSIIDKVRSTHHKVVALVLPKRAAMLQSSVNMKLLKRAGEQSKKNLVLITTEAGLLPLAGAVGLHVAKNLQSRPEIPAMAAAAGAGALADELFEAEEAADDFDPKSASDKAIGELSGNNAESAAKAKPELAPRPIPHAKPDDAMELDNTADKAVATGKRGAKTPKDKSKKIPNFDKFRKRLIFGAIGVAALIVLLILGLVVLPTATIVVATNTSSVNSNLSIALDSSAQTLDPNQLVVPAKVQQSQKTGSKQVPTTGQKNLGQTASGTATLVNCDNNSVNIPAGTGISGNNLTYITQQAVSLSPGNFDSHGNCKTNGSQASSGSANITAQSGGSNYNTSFSGGSVAGFNGVTASGSASGGTDNNVQVVTQTDIDTAKQQISMPNDASMKSTLASDLKAEGYYPIYASYNAAPPNVSTSANVGDQASTVTVTETITYTMFGAHRSDLNALIISDVNSQINTSKQSIQNTGIGNANFSVLSQTANKSQMTMQATATVGPKLNLVSLKSQVAGKKKGEVQALIQSNPGVTGVSVHFSPFWVSSTPKSTSKITIKFQKASS